jgi:hypothetical protein
MGADKRSFVMDSVTYAEVVKLAEQLSPADQQALVAHLQTIAKQRELSFEEWKILFESAIIHRPILRDISNRREDWYDDDGR